VNCRIVPWNDYLQTQFKLNQINKKMENFIVYNPTCVFFGKNVIQGMQKTVSPLGNKALLIYGKGSVKSNGIYDAVVKQLNDCGITIAEYSGIKANPIIDDARKAAEKGKESQADFIVAVGGGSVIDTAKLVSVCIKEPLDPWDVMKSKIKPRTNIPVIAVLTLAATGTEMNPYAVLQNHETKEKIGFGMNLMYPKYSFLDPQYTYSVPKDQTAYGIVDLIAHTLEAYFAYGDASLSDRFAESIIKEAIEIAPLLLANPENYHYRSRVMWAATCALNGSTSYGRATSGDWGVHDIGHTLSMLYDFPHGATLSVAYPAWLKLQKEKIKDRISLLGKNVFGVNNANETISEIEKFFASLNCPVSLKELGLNDSHKTEIFELLSKNKITGYHHKLEEEDYKRIVELMFGV